MFGPDDNHYLWGWGLMILETPSQLRIMGVATLCCGSVFIQEKLLALNDIVGIMSKEHYMEILKQYLNTSSKLKLGYE